MSGYLNYSMSYNAVTAYENGEKPFSKWTKSDILETLAASGYPHIEKAKRLKAQHAKELFLRCSGWHHTSKFYNRTRFYEVKTDVPENHIDWFLTGCVGSFLDLVLKEGKTR